jgi:hypothetical protein
MPPLPPLSRLRKGTVFLVFLLLSFVFYRLLLFKTNEDSFHQENDAPSLSTEICLLVTESGPVNADSVFNIKNISSKIFAYSSLDTGFNTADTVWHVWYHGSKKIKRIACSMDGASCVSFISLDSLKAGAWSLDARQKDILLHVKQFSIEEL